MTPETAESLWPSATPPPVAASSPVPTLRWELSALTQLPRVRAEVRRHTTAADGPSAADLRDQLILALDEMASNALRHGGGTPVVAALQETDDAYIIDVADGALSAPPTPAVGRDPSEGGLGLYLIAELAVAHGWYIDDDGKHVWALLPRR